MNFYLGLDNGGTTTKAALYDAEGKEIAIASAGTNTEAQNDGMAERDMEVMWANNCSVIKKLLETSKVRPEQIKCIAVCGHGKGLYLWGKDGRPAMKGIPSTDNRAWKYPEKWEKDGTAEKVFKISNQHIMALQPVSLLAWIKDHHPEVVDNIQWIFSCKDYIRFRLTGEAFAEYSDYSGDNLINLKTKEYDPELLKLFGIEDLQYALPPLKYATEICGTIHKDVADITGLKEGTPVAGGLFDINACALASGIVDDRHICMIAGTWSINEYIRKSPVLDGTAFMNSLFAIKDFYLVEECSPTSAGNQGWILKNMFKELAEHKEVYKMFEKELLEIPEEELCPIFLPFILGTNVHPNAKGSIVGITQNHTRGHIFRAIYEGICFSHKYHLEKLKKTRKNIPEAIRLSGGVTNSEVWTQMFADIMELPIETVCVKEAGTLGCAICAAVACGEYQNVTDAVQSMTKVEKKIYPQGKNKDVYRKKYELYIKAITCLDELWTSIQNF